MFARFKNFISNTKKNAKKEESESAFEVGVAPQNDSIREDLQEKRDKVAEFLQPVDENWEFIQLTLLWKNSLPACICFFAISGIFWKFINLKLRKIVLIFGGILLASGLSSDFKAASWDFCQRNFHLEVQGDPVLPFTFEDLCLFIATNWAMFLYAWNSLQNLSSEYPPKFYCIVAVSLFALLALFTYFPVLECIYVTICALFFYPALHHYGILDRIHGRVGCLTEPILRHWENNRTRRTRSITRPTLSSNEVQNYDSDDEFCLEKNKFTSKVLSSVVPDENISDNLDSESDNETYNQQLHGEMQHSDGDVFSESHFEKSLAMPSMSNFDSLMEPYDEFHAGLSFPDYTDGSRMDPLNVLNAAANNIDTDEEIDDLPYEAEAEHFHLERNNYNDKRQRIYHPSNEEDCYDGEFQNPSELEPSSSNVGVNEDRDFKKDFRQAIETDFEFLEHADLEEDAPWPGNSQEPTEGALVTPKMGLGTVSKWLGYD